MSFKYFRLLFCITLLISCVSNEINDQLKKNIKLNNSVIKTYRDAVSESLDSIKKYELDSIYRLAISYIYTIYGREKIVDDRAINGLVINNCKVEITNFYNDTSINTILYFTVFLNDSVPTYSGFKTSLGNMISGIAIDRKNKFIKYGILGGTGTVPVKFENISEIYDSISNNREFRKYVSENFDYLNFKFKETIKR